MKIFSAGNHTLKFKFINILIDEQAAARIHRPEQIENVAIYRLITSETVEEWIYQRQVYKHNVAQHVLTDNHNDQRNLLSIDIPHCTVYRFFRTFCHVTDERT